VYAFIAGMIRARKRKTRFPNYNLVRRKYMNKKLLTVAIGAALAVPMFAQAAVTVGGQAHISADYVDTFAATGAAVNASDTKKMWNVSSNVSNIFFKAEEDLGGGLTGVFFLQEYFRLDDNGGATQSTITASNRMHDAPAYAGLSSKSFGSILLGNMDSPTKNTGRAVDLFGNAIGDSRNTAVDNTRFQNSVFYSTPNFGGVVVTLAHSTNLDNTIAATSADTAVNVGSTATAVGGSKTGNALGVKFEQGPVMVIAAYQQVIDNNNTSATTYDDNTIMNVGAGFKVGPARIVGFYQQAKANGNVVDTDADTYGIGASFKFGNETIKAQFYNVTKSKLASTDVTASVYAIGYDHAFSKAFTGYVAIAAASNDTGTAGGNNVGMAGGGGHGDTPNVFAGEDQNGLSLGVIYNF
jgi:predicted porin